METRTLSSGIKRYREKIYIKNKPLISKWFGRKIDANQWKSRQLTVRDQNIALGLPQTYNIEFKNVLDKLLKSKSNLSNNTLKSYNGVAEKYLIPYFGKELINSITLLQVEDFKYFLIQKQKLSNNRINFIMKILKMSFEFAFDLNCLKSNHIRKLKLIKIEKKEIKYWSIEDSRKFLNSTRNDYYYYFYLVALNTGLRLGEIVGLLWDSINFNRSQMIIKRTMTRHGLQESTKSKRPRVIPMNDIVKRTLIILKNNNHLSEYVFTQPNGDHVSYEHFTVREFNKTLKKINIPKIQFRNLRTTFASNFCMNNGNIFSLSKILGHSTVEVTQQKYAFLNDKFLWEEINKFEINSNVSTVTEPEIKVI